MTYEEALKYANDISFCTGCNVNESYLDADDISVVCDKCEHRNFFNIAIKAIGKQIPIKPVVKKNENGFDKSYHCPCCDAWLGTDPDDFCNDWVNVCNKCYQVIDWSEEFEG